MYNRDVDIVIYICIYVCTCMHTDARPTMPSHRYTHACKSTRTRMHDEMAADRRRCGRRCACVCASGHPYTPRCTSVDTHFHAIYTYIHMHVHALTRRRTHMYMYIVTHMWRSRARIAPPLPPRARTRTRTHAQARAHTHAGHACYERTHASTHARIHM